MRLKSIVSAISSPWVVVPAMVSILIGGLMYAANQKVDPRYLKPTVRAEAEAGHIRYLVSIEKDSLQKLKK
ncbi:MAG: hypothetical protein JWN50_347 [Parcubacteria group bacterium]|nr:hypothetical protein [Parcubacteria group bacterium]